MQDWTNIINVSFNSFFPYGEAKDRTLASDGTENKDGTPVNKITSTEDIYNAMLNALQLAGLTPNEKWETPTESQFIDAFFILFGDIGSIVELVGSPLSHSRLLKLDGSLIDLSQEKYKYFRNWINTNRTNNIQIFVNHNTADAVNDRFKFKFDPLDGNKIWLPKPKKGDVLRQFSALDNTTLGNSDNGIGGGVGEHEHELEPFKTTVPNHRHTINFNNAVWKSAGIGGKWEYSSTIDLSGNWATGTSSGVAGASQSGIRTNKTILPAKKVASNKDNIGAGGNIAFYIKY